MEKLLPLAAVLALGACATSTPPANAPLRVAGEVFYLERIALPPGAVLRISVQDVARADAAAVILAQEDQPAVNGPPFAFDIKVPRDKITPQSRVAVRAQIMTGQKLMFTSTEHHPVTLDGPQPPIRIRVSIVPGS